MIHSTILSVTFAFTRLALNMTLVILELLTILEDSITTSIVIAVVCRIVILNIICISTAAVVAIIAIVGGVIAIVVVIVGVVLSITHLLLVLLLLSLQLLLFLNKVCIGVLIKVKI